MEQAEALKILRGFLKWRRGRGKKYACPGAPEGVDDALDIAIKCVDTHVCDTTMLLVGNIVRSAIAEKSAVMGDPEHKRTAKEFLRLVGRVARRRNAKESQ